MELDQLYLTTKSENLDWLELDLAQRQTLAKYGLNIHSSLPAIYT